MRWYDGLSEREQDDIEAIVDLLTEQGPSLPRPHSDHVRDSRHSNMRELRVQSGGDPYRIFYAFDPRRNAILLIGVTREGIIAFMFRIFLWQITYTTCICTNCVKKG